MADKIAVMYAGQIIEKGEKRDIFYNPKHPYTWALLNSVPKLEWKEKQVLDTIKGTPIRLKVGMLLNVGYTAKNSQMVF